MSRSLSATARQTALAHATAIVLRDGVDALTFEGLARESGVAKTTLYRHWEDRAALLRTAFDALIQPLPPLDTGSLRGDLEALVAEAPSREAEMGRRVFFLLMEAALHDPAVREVQVAMVHERTQPIRLMIESAIQRGELATDTDIDLAIDMVLGPLLAHHIVRELPVEPSDGPRVVAATLAALVALGGSGPAPGSIEVLDAPERSRFELFVDGERAGHADYVRRGDRWLLPHVEIDPRREGHGLGSLLVAEMVAELRDRGARVTPICPFVVAWFDRHPDDADLLADA